jgi:hypothetical protein
MPLTTTSGRQPRSFRQSSCSIGGPPRRDAKRPLALLSGRAGRRMPSSIRPTSLLGRRYRTDASRVRPRRAAYARELLLFLGRLGAQRIDAFAVGGVERYLRRLQRFPPTTAAPCTTSSCSATRARSSSATPGRPSARTRRGALSEAQVIELAAARAGRSTSFWPACCSTTRCASPSRRRRRRRRRPAPGPTRPCAPEAVPR